MNKFWVKMFFLYLFLTTVSAATSRKTVLGKGTYLENDYNNSTTSKSKVQRKKKKTSKVRNVNSQIVQSSKTKNKMFKSFNDSKVNKKRKQIKSLKYCIFWRDQFSDSYQKRYLKYWTVLRVTMGMFPLRWVLEQNPWTTRQWPKIACQYPQRTKEHIYAHEGHNSKNNSCRLYLFGQLTKLISYNIFPFNLSIAQKTLIIIPDNKWYLTSFNLCNV